MPEGRNPLSAASFITSCFTVSLSFLLLLPFAFIQVYLSVKGLFSHLSSFPPFLCILTILEDNRLVRYFSFGSFMLVSGLSSSEGILYGRIKLLFWTARYFTFVKKLHCNKITKFWVIVCSLICTCSCF